MYIRCRRRRTERIKREPAKKTSSKINSIPLSNPNLEHVQVLIRTYSILFQLTSFSPRGNIPIDFSLPAGSKHKERGKSCSIFHLVRSPPAFFFRLEVCVPFAPSVRSFRSRDLKKRNRPRFLTCGYDRKFQNREKHWGKMNGGKKQQLSQD